jgi:hypothetical protein
MYSEVQQIELDPAVGFNLHLSLAKVILPIQAPPDTQWVKHIKFQSKLLSNRPGAKTRPATSQHPRTRRRCPCSLRRNRDAGDTRGVLSGLDVR